MTENKSEQSIVDDHRNMMMLSKKLSDWHIKNMTHWAFIVFDNLKSVKVEYNFDDGQTFNAGTVSYHFTFNDNLLPEEVVKNKGLESLSLWTKSIFWQDTKVKFKTKNKIWK